MRTFIIELLGIGIWSGKMGLKPTKTHFVIGLTADSTTSTRPGTLLDIKLNKNVQLKTNCNLKKICPGANTNPTSLLCKPDESATVRSV